MLRQELSNAKKRIGNWIIDDPGIIKRSFVKYFSSANREREHPEDTKAMLNIVTATAAKIKSEVSNIRKNCTGLTIFDDQNEATHPVADDAFDVRFTSVPAVRYKLKRLPNKTSAGANNIPSIVLKHLPEQIVKNITIIFNNLINSTYFPSKWKITDVHPILKGGEDPCLLISYRAVSLNSNFSKESIIVDKLTIFSKEKNIIPREQYGFEQQLSTTHAVDSVFTKVSNHLNNNRRVGALFIDLEKAFDSVWLDGLLFKLHKKNFPDHLIKQVCTMTSKKKFRVTGSEEVFRLYHGLQQGTASSPYLFKIYFIDI